MNEVQAPQPRSLAEETVREGAVPSASRRRLIRGGLVGAPVVLTAISTPVMATTCMTASRMASMHSSLAAKNPTCTADTTFEITTVISAMDSLVLTSLTSAVETLKKEKKEKVFKAIKAVREGKASIVKNILTDTLEIINPTEFLSGRDRLLLLTHLNVATPRTNFYKVISLEDVRRMADGSYSNPHLKPTDIEPYLCSLFGFTSADQARIIVV